MPAPQRQGLQRRHLRGDSAECSRPAIGATSLLQLGPAQDQSASDLFGSIRLFGGVCGGFRPASGLCGEAPPLSVQLHQMDRCLGGAVLFSPQVRSELLMWVLKLMKFIDDVRLLAQVLRGTATAQATGTRAAL